MTNEDVIKELTQMRKNFDSNSVYGSYCIDCLDAAIEALKEQPKHSQNTSSKQPDLDTLGIKTGETCEDAISRQAAIDNLKRHLNETDVPDSYPGIFNAIEEWLSDWEVPSAQPGQHTCVNCGRTVNNGGWYADGRTRCPIEEHYALPKNGYCHLWEKRNVTDDDYPERRTDE